MKLFEHPDFEQAILRATEHFDNHGLRAAIIEKDYYVTEALRLIATTAPDKIIFKGGTSLAKGWNLIQRFSEDIDIFLDPLAFKPRLGKNAIDRELKKLRDTVGSHAALTFVADESKTIGGLGSPTCNSSAVPAKSPIASFSKQAPPAAANRLASSNCAPIWDSSSRKLTSHWARRTRADFRSVSCISVAPSSKKCLPSTAKSNCSNATGVHSEPMQGTTTTCFNLRRRRK
jgi:hypothetical protein